MPTGLESRIQATSSEPIPGPILPSFEWLADYLIHAKHWQPDAACRGVAECRLFLSACKASPRLLVPPSVECDEVWHAFILHTARYAAYCEENVGHFLHHTPMDFAAAPVDSSSTIELMKRLDPAWAGHAAEFVNCDDGQRPRPNPGPIPPAPVCTRSVPT